MTDIESAIKKEDMNNIIRMITDKSANKNQAELIRLIKEIRPMNCYSLVKFLVDVLLMGVPGKAGDVIFKKIREIGDKRIDVYLDMILTEEKKVKEFIYPVFSSLIVEYGSDIASIIESKKGVEFSKKVNNLIHSDEFMKTIDIVWRYYINNSFPKNYYSK